MHTRLLIAIVILHSSFNILPAAPPPELTVLRTQYDKVVAERVTAVFDASKATLDSKFTTALDNAIATAKGAGELKTVLALEAEKKRLTDKLPIPAEDNAAPEPLQKLRAIYQEQLTKLEEVRSANHAALLPAYSAKLQQLEVTLTKADRVAEAAEVLAYREGLAVGATTPPPAQTAAVPVTSTAPATMPETKTTSLKPSEAAALNRQLAEWCLNNRHEVSIEANRRRIPNLRNLQDLPKDEFEVLRINLVGSMPLGTESEFPWAALAAAPNLEFMLLDLGQKNAEVTMANLAHLDGCKSLATLQLGGKINWVDLDLSKLPSLPELKTLMVHKFTQATNLAPLREKFPKLGSIAFGAFSGSGIPAEVFDQLLQWTDLRELRLDGTGLHITAAHVAALRKLPKLRSLILYPFNAVYDPSLASLGKVEHVNLNYECPIDTYHAVCSMPGITTLHVSGNKNVTDADFALVGGLTKLTELKAANMSALTDAAIAHLSPLKTLTNLNLSGTPITDAVLPALAKMKKLKKLDVKNTHITEAGAAAFKKQRPDVEFTR